MADVMVQMPTGVLIYHVMTVTMVTVRLTVMVTVKALLLKIVLVSVVVLPNLISAVSAPVTTHVKKAAVEMMVDQPVKMAM